MKLIRRLLDDLLQHAPAPGVGAASGDSQRLMFRRFAQQVAVLALAASAIFWAFYGFDHVVATRGVAGATDIFGGYFRFDAESVSNAVAALSGVNAAVFGIVITVVSIILQLSASRYAGVTHMFLRDRTNVLVAAYYVIACVASVWLSTSIRLSFVPVATLTAMLAVTTGGLVLMVPYFGYVFWFLEPTNIIRRIREEAISRATAGALSDVPEVCFAAQAQTLFALEELTDIANSSISGKDKIVASAAVDALKDFAVAYLKVKPRASDAWCSIGPGIQSNPDFVALDPEVRLDLEHRRGWVEWKVMRQYSSIYAEALAAMRDINYLIAIDTRYIGEEACRSNDGELIGQVLRFYNTYLRATLNARDVRTAYNVLNQYRKFVEGMLERGNNSGALEAVRHMKYYGLVSFEMNLSFVTETVAYDLSSVAQLAHNVGSSVENEILNEFLELDRGPFLLGQEKALIGVRKAQVKLAAYYIASGEEARARRIAEDMRHESRERLAQIHRQLAEVTRKDYWEIIDRGGNFEFMPPEQRACLPQFFGWLEPEAPSAPG